MLRRKKKKGVEMSKYQELKNNKRSASDPLEEIKAHHALRDYERWAAGLIDAANKRIAELEAALATIESEVFELPCQSCGLSSECSAHDLISRIEAAIKRAKGGAK